MKFEELDPEVQDEVREWQTDDSWWDFVYEDAVRMGAIIGITIYDRVVKSVRGKPLSQPDIYFDLGRGSEVTFDGSLSYRVQALDEIKRETSDEVLIGLAQRLDAIFVKIRLMDWPVPRVHISHHDNVDIIWDWDGDMLMPDDDIERIICDFKTWLWNRLNDEYDYLTSDEHLSEYDYEEDGTRI